MTILAGFTGLPLRSVPLTFAADAEAFFGQLSTFKSELNAIIAELNALAAAMTLNDTTGTSTTSLTIGTGSKSLTVETGKSYWPGMSVKIAYTTDGTKWMHGDVTSYDTGTGALVVNVTTIQGSGTYTSWTITLSAPNITVEYSKTVVYTSDGSLSTAEMAGNYTLTNEGAVGAVNRTAPALVAGMRIRVHNIEAYDLKVTLTGTDKFRVDGVDGSAAGYAHSATKGCVWEIVCNEDGIGDVIVNNIPPVDVDE